MNKEKIIITRFESETLEQEVAQNLVDKIVELVKKNKQSLLLLSGGAFG